MISYFCKFLLHYILGYKLHNPELIDKIKTGKHIVVFAHTTAWEFFIAAFVFRYAYQLPNVIGMSYIGNFSNVFLRFIMNTLNFFPVDTNIKTNVVDKTSDMLNKYDDFLFVISPEGARAYVEKFKTGYYYIAKKTNANITILHIDFLYHTIGFQNILPLDDDVNKMNQIISNEFSQHHQLYPENTFYGKQIKGTTPFNYNIFQSLYKLVPTLTTNIKHVKNT
jgi:1-acyl-sn-glycerol-3-phosphate acyltransferase